MKKRIVLGGVPLALAAAIGAAYAAYPAESLEVVAAAKQIGLQVWDGVKANPVPTSLALGTFLVTVIYYRARGRTLREAVEVAATRVTVVPVPVAESETLVVRRAKARATRTQLLADQIALQDRLRKLPEAIVRAEKETCYTQHAVAETERKLADRRRAHEEATARLEALRNEQACANAELAEIEVELEKLAELI